MGFCFDSEMIIPQGIRYKTKVYKLKRFYPHDEKTEDFFFDLVKNSQYLQIVRRGNMTQKSNKQFNTYKEGLDQEFLREYCMEHGEAFDES